MDRECRELAFGLGEEASAQANTFESNREIYPLGATGILAIPPDLIGTRSIAP
jgi:hypothetical protein